MLEDGQESAVCSGDGPKTNFHSKHRFILIGEPLSEGDDLDSRRDSAAITELCGDFRIYLSVKGSRSVNSAHIRNFGQYEGILSIASQWMRKRHGSARAVNALAVWGVQLHKKQ